MGLRAIAKKFTVLQPLVWLVDGRRLALKEKNQRRWDIEWQKTNEYVQHQRVKPWVEANGDETLRINYDLNEQSLVFDLGGYKGEWASLIVNKYNCTVYVFEPVHEFFAIIDNKFLRNKKIKRYPLALSNASGKMEISLLDNSTSLYAEGARKEKIQLKRAAEFIRENKIEEVDLMKINIEGAEYDLLEDLLAEGLITVFKNIQVQFHDFIMPNAKERMVKIQDQLKKTHRPTWQYEFVWENWQRI